MKKGSILTAIVFASMIFCAQTSLATTGFVDSPIWIIPSKPDDTDMVKLSAVFRNEEADSISGTIFFYDNETLLAQKAVTILPGDVRLVSTNFKITAGSHQFSATMSNAATLAGSGKLGVVVVAKATVSLPSQFVPKAVPITAQTGGDTVGGSEGLILDEIEKAQTSVLAVIPEPTKKAVAETATTIDSWRADNAQSFAKNRDKAQKAVDHKVPDTSKPSGTVLGGAKPAPIMKSDAGPMEYVKLVVFSALAFLFMYPAVFYFIAAFLIFIIIRFIFRRIARRGSGDQGHLAEH
jgi:hypothetical protein